MTSELLGWINQKTGQVEYFNGLPQEDRVLDFLPQTPVTENAHKVYRKLGYSQAQSMINIIRAYLGMPEETE